MKDPAFLFYPGDWMGGTLLLNRPQKGCYIDLLVAQFNNGPLTLEEIKTLLGSDFGHWPKLEKKFTFMDGRYYNQRLETEKHKRSSFTSSRRANAKHMPKHMEDVNEDRNVIETKNTYGEFQNVFLSEEEYKKLTEYCKTENNLKLLIVDLSGYIRNQKKDPYVDHYATLQKWWRTQVKNHVETNKPKRTIA